MEYDCRELNRAIKGLGTNEEALIEILASRSRKRLQDINNLYPQCKYSFRYFCFNDAFFSLFAIVFKNTLEKDVVGDTSRHLKKILVALLHGDRPDTNQVNEDEAESDAKALYDAGEKKWGTDESKFVDIVLSRR